MNDSVLFVTVNELRKTQFNFLYIFVTYQLASFPVDSFWFILDSVYDYSSRAVEVVCAIVYWTMNPWRKIETVSYLPIF